MLSTVFISFSLLATAFAAPFQPEHRDVLAVYSPKITSPTASTTWVVGNSYDVTWDPSSLPSVDNITNVVGQVLLGQFNGNGENLFADNPLATGFLLTDAQVKITVPSVPDGNYMVVLFGDSGNTSPQFKIVNNPLSSLFDSSTASSTQPPTSTSTSESPLSSSTSDSVKPFSGSGSMTSTPDNTASSSAFTSGSSTSSSAESAATSFPLLSLGASSTPSTLNNSQSTLGSTSALPSGTSVASSNATPMRTLSVGAANLTFLLLATWLML